MGKNKGKEVFHYESIDNETGEIINRISIKKRKVNTNFVLLFLDDELNILRDNKMVTSVLCEFIRCMSYANPDNYGQTVSLTPSIKKRIAEDCKIQLNTLTKIMAQMIELNIMKRIDRSTYMINPRFIGKGSIEDVLKAQVVYDEL